MNVAGGLGVDGRRVMNTRGSISCWYRQYRHGGDAVTMAKWFFTKYFEKGSSILASPLRCYDTSLERKSELASKVLPLLTSLRGVTRILAGAGVRVLCPLDVPRVAQKRNPSSRADQLRFPERSREHQTTRSTQSNHTINTINPSQ